MRPDLSGLRAMAAGLLTDTGTVKRQTGETTQDPDTGREVPVYDTLHDGAMLAMPATVDSDLVRVAEVSLALQTYTVWLPPSVDTRTGDKVVLTSCHYDPSFVGVELTVTGAVHDGLEVAKRLVAQTST